MRKHNQLLLKSWHTNSRTPTHQNHNKQRHLHPRRQIYDHRHLKFVYQHSHETLRIPQTTDMQHPRRNRKSVQSTREVNIRRKCICGYPKGMYGLPQAGLIVKKLLKRLSAKHKYTQSRIVP